MAFHLTVMSLADLIPTLQLAIGPDILISGVALKRGCADSEIFSTRCRS
jgi:hypothetical protein